MLGYSDPYGGIGGSSVGSPDAGVYYSNLQVVQLSQPAYTINSIAISSGIVVIDFITTSPIDTASSFTLRISGTVNGAYDDVIPAASILSLGRNQFRASTAYTGGTQRFYRLHHN